MSSRSRKVDWESRVESYNEDMSSQVHRDSSTVLGQIRSDYEADGFYIADRPLVPAEVVSSAVAGMDEVRVGRYDIDRTPQGSDWNPGDDPNMLCKIEMPQFVNRAMHRLVSDPMIGQVAAAATGATWLQAWWVQMFYKPTSNAQYLHTKVGWHQDLNYWPAWEADSELLTAWVALGEVGADSGPMLLLRGSHRWGRFPDGDFYDKDRDLAAQGRAMGFPVGETWDEVPVLLPAGGLSLHHCLTVHGSGPNISNQPRRSVAIHLRTENSRPVGDRREALTEHIEDLDRCPVIFTAP